MQKYFQFVTFSHTVFALPFALAGVTLGYLDAMPTDWPSKVGLVLACMVFARSAAMGFNRWLDRDIDAMNPRTAIREIPAGRISAVAALRFVFTMSALFILTTYFINKLCFFLSPIALLIILGYSYTKRFTAMCHIVLGLGLGLAPVGAYLAMTGYFDLLPLLMGASVLLWVAGFDIIYALQDEEFDRDTNLHSIPVRLGSRVSLRLSEALHLLSALLLSYVTWRIGHTYIQSGWLLLLGLATFLALLVYQHQIVRENDLSRVNRAFFTTNGFASVIFGVALIADLLH